jgi:hypothetical protein
MKIQSRKINPGELILDILFIAAILYFVAGIISNIELRLL